MSHCDFYSIVQILQNYTKELKKLSQEKFVKALFGSFEQAKLGFDFETGAPSRWINGERAVSPQIVKYYLANRSNLTDDIKSNIFPLLYDQKKVVSEIYNLVINDFSISSSKKKKLTENYPCNDKDSAADFIAEILLFSVTRKFISREELKNQSSLVISNIEEIMYVDRVPKPCKYFCGRDKELEELHGLYLAKSKIFVTGIAGIGKSEFAKAYADEYRKEYADILYFTYNGSLKKMIADIDFADDKPEDDTECLFKLHNRYLRNLKDNTLIIIDNFNTSAADEEVLDVVMKYGCNIIFTTRSRFDCGYTFELNEIESTETLVDLSSKFYPAAINNREIVSETIDTIHHHTLSVELAARLLQKCLIEPDELLSKLKENAVNPHTADKIKISKDGLSIKDTYFNHLHTLFSLNMLNEEMQTAMRCMAFVPTEGISAKLFAQWLNLSDLNSVNDLVELGFIKEDEDEGTISLLPIMKDIVIEDLKPAVSNIRVLISSIIGICIRHGEEIPCAKTLFAVIENIISSAEKDDIPEYILFIQNAFEAFEKERNEHGMKLIISEMEKYSDRLSANDIALMYDCKGAVELINEEYGKARDYALKAVKACVPEEDVHLASNLYMNLGYFYHLVEDLDNARKYMDEGMKYLAQLNQRNRDYIISTRKYADLVSDCGEPIKAVRILKKCAEELKADRTDMCADYADLNFDMGIIYYQMGEKEKSEQSLTEAFRVYKAIYADNGEALSEKIIQLQQFTGTTELPLL